MKWPLDVAHQKATASLHWADPVFKFMFSCGLYMKTLYLMWIRRINKKEVKNHSTLSYHHCPCYGGSPDCRGCANRSKGLSSRCSFGSTLIVHTQRTQIWWVTVRSHFNLGKKKRKREHMWIVVGCWPRFPWKVSWSKQLTLFAWPKQKV